MFLKTYKELLKFKIKAEKVSQANITFFIPIPFPGSVKNLCEK